MERTLRYVRVACFNFVVVQKYNDVRGDISLCYGSEIDISEVEL